MDNDSEYLQIDMGAQHPVCAVATQGADIAWSRWTTRYKLSLSSDEVTWASFQENNATKVIAIGRFSSFPKANFRPG